MVATTPLRGGGGGVLPYMSYIKYVRHQRVGYSSHFDLKFGIDFDILACK